MALYHFNLIFFIYCFQQNDLHAGVGAGRIFNTNVTLSEAIKLVQKHIGLNVHVANGLNHSLDSTIQTVAVCAGAGAGLLKAFKADLYITGEMSHHDVLETQHKNTSVILCNHTNSERGFLNRFQKMLGIMLKGQCHVEVSSNDKDPLITYVAQQ